MNDKDYVVITAGINKSVMLILSNYMVEKIKEKQ